MTKQRFIANAPDKIIVLTVSPPLEKVACAGTGPVLSKG